MAPDMSHGGGGEVRSTLYGFKNRKPSCLQYPAREVTDDKSTEKQLVNGIGIIGLDQP